MSSSVKVRDTRTAAELVRNFQNFVGPGPVRDQPVLVRESLVRVLFFSSSQKPFQAPWRASSSLLDVLFDIPVVLFWTILYRFSDWTANERKIWNLSWVYLQTTSGHMQQTFAIDFCHRKDIESDPTFYHGDFCA